jgi:1-acyl-sn-glycerol-3-phosphate acyltransferase
VEEREAPPGSPSPDLTPIRAQIYEDTREADYFQGYHEYARKGPPGTMYEVVRMAVSLYTWVLFRARAIGAERVPASGAVILAPNHSSFLDHFFVATFIRRKVRFMAKSQLFKPPLQYIFSRGGVFPVRRGLRDEEAFVTANVILERGGCVAMYSEGGRSRTGRLGDRVRPGIGRLALQSGATVVPVAIHGSALVRNWRRGRFPKVTILYGEPLRFERVAEPTRTQQRAVAEEIFAEIRALYERLEREGRAGALARARAERRGGRDRTATA